DLVIVSGEYGLRALDRSSGRIMWEQLYAKAAELLLGASEAIEGSGRGFLAGGMADVPPGQALLGFDVHTGQPTSAMRWPQVRNDAGNAMAFRDLLVAAGNSRLAIYFDPTAALSSALDRTSKNGDN